MFPPFVGELIVVLIGLVSIAVNAGENEIIPVITPPTLGHGDDVIDGQICAEQGIVNLAVMARGVAGAFEHPPAVASE